METTNSKRQQKVYGGSATSRSRTATKDLECKNLTLFSDLLLLCSRHNFSLVLTTVPPSDALMCQPQFVKPLSEMTIKDGEALKLTCIVKGDPDPNVTWLKNGEVIGKIIRNVILV